ncbi:glycosyltransferase family 2 protein [Aquiflexum gelatinilyticum]|uniref:glycosyltransferase family 2 protein n=1 Tax=Aquiflexum gelatinilyticum TaxID=2961943 RepID=UPI0021680872|nr:glycosyltransferase family A protein [Aquiflexum gelatinilyticum]MCS4434336.1 glycosyltransferase family 2 protein [Aquiflexum gelatinilyticum]
MFSVIIPLFNKSNYILRTIESVQKQSFQDWEIIVIDDGSTDDGYEKILSLNSKRITLLKKENTGVSASRNLGISKAQFPYIAFLDADDYWHEDYLKLMKKGIELIPNTLIWASSFTKELTGVNVSTKDFEKIDNYFQKDFRNTLFFTSSVIMKKKFFENHPGFKSHLKRGEDLDVWFRAICLGGNLAYCKSSPVYYERGDSTGATKTSFPLKASLLSHILRDDYLLSHEIEPSQYEKFENFKNKFVYLNLIKYASNPENNKEITNILNQITKKNYWVDLVYKLPYKFLILILNNKRGSRLLNRYISYNLKISIF